MKLKYILMAGLACATFASCNDYLDVDTPSKYDDKYVFGTETEINRALNGVYAQLLNSNLYGENFLTNFCFNSDVDFQPTHQKLQQVVLSVVLTVQVMPASSRRPGMLPIWVLSMPTTSSTS